MATFKLESIAQLEQEIGRRRHEIASLQQDKDHLLGELNRAQVQQRWLAKQIGEHESELKTVSQSLFLKLAELDRLLQIQDKVSQRAAEVAQQRKQELREGGGYLAQTIDEYSYMKNRRGEQRVALAVDLSLESGNNFYVGFSENITRGGIYVVSYATLPVGEQLMVALSLPGDDEAIHCLAEVVWVRDYTGEVDVDAMAPPGMGLAFRNISSADRDRIEAFVATRQPLFMPEVDELA